MPTYLVRIHKLLEHEEYCDTLCKHMVRAVQPVPQGYRYRWCPWDHRMRKGREMTEPDSAQHPQVWLDAAASTVRAPIWKL